MLHDQRGNMHTVRQVAVLKADFFRLAIVWLDGGWWLDADVRCVDPLAATLTSAPIQAEVSAAAARAAAAATGTGHVAQAWLTENATCTTGPVPVGCVLAWEGEVSPPAPAASGRGAGHSNSSPLNWAFGCAPRHALPLTALAEAASRVLAWQAASQGPLVSPREFGPRTQPNYHALNAREPTGRRWRLRLRWRWWWQRRCGGNIV